MWRIIYDRRISQQQRTIEAQGTTAPQKSNLRIRKIVVDNKKGRHYGIES